MNFDNKKNPFGNYDEPMPPASYRRRIKNKLVRKILWTFRNPLHNFANYWIGVRGKVKAFRGRFLDRGDHIGLITVKCVERSATTYYNLPILSYRGYILEGYLGWRPSGAFGFVPFRPANAKDASET